MRQVLCGHRPFDMNDLRTSVDAAESLIPERYLPYPTYDEILYSLR